MKDWDADEDEAGLWVCVEFIAVGAMITYVYVVLVMISLCEVSHGL